MPFSPTRHRKAPGLHWLHRTEMSRDHYWLVHISRDGIGTMCRPMGKIRVSIPVVTPQGWTWVLARNVPVAERRKLIAILESGPD